MQLILIAALTPDHIIGTGEGLPWHIPEDLKFFLKTTSGHTVIMGRKTFDTIKAPLPRRRNIVVTRDPNPPVIAGVQWAASLEAAIALAGNVMIYICGGSQIYGEALPRANTMILTWVRLNRPVQGVTYFPKFNLAEWEKVQSQVVAITGPESGEIEFARYERIR